MYNLRRKISAIICVAAVVTLCSVAALAADYSLFGDATLTSPGNNSPTAAQLTSSSDGTGYGGVDLSIPDGITFADLTTLSTDYMFTEGTCGGGSPRFQVNVTNPETGDSGNIFVYVGPAPNYTNCQQGVWVNSGDLLESGLTIDTSQLTGGTFYDQFDNAVTAFGSYEVTGVQLVVDSYWFNGTQTVLVDNVAVNGNVETFENANTCKKDGYLLFTAAPGPFKNQGQCVSYFARGGQ